MKQKFTLWLVALLTASMLWSTQLEAIPVINSLKWENTPPLKSGASNFTEGFEGDISAWALGSEVAASDLSGAFGPAGNLTAPKEGSKALLFPMMMEATTRSAITPELDLSTLSTPILKFFWERIAQDGSGSATTISVNFYESENKTTWALIAKDPTATLTGTDKTWKEHSVTLKTTTKYVKIEVSCTASAFNVLAIDELSIMDGANLPTEALSEINEGFEGDISAWALSSEVTPHDLSSGFGPAGTLTAPKEGSKALLFPMMMEATTRSAITPKLDLSALSTPILKFFWERIAQDGGGSATTISVNFYESENKTTWALIAKDPTATLTGTDKTWKEHSVSLKASTKYVKIEVSCTATAFNVLAIDELSIMDGANLPAEALSEINEGFEGTPCLPATWSVIDPSPESFTWICSSDDKNSGANSLYFTPFTDGSVKAGDVGLLLPELDLSKVNSPSISLFWKMTTWSGDPSPSIGQGGMSFEIWTSSTTTETAAFTKLSEIPKGSASFEELTVSLNTGVKYVKIKVIAQGPNGKLFIDDLRIGTPLIRPLTSIFENFEGDDFPSTNWKLESDRPTASKNWRKNTTVSAHSGNGTAESLGNAWDQHNTFILPQLDLSGLEKPILSFFYKNENLSNQSNKSGLYIYTSTDGTIYERGQKINTATNGQWTNYQEFIKKDVKYVKIEHRFERAGDEKPTYIDDIYLGEITPELCVRPQNVMFTDSSYTSLTLDWEQLGNQNAKWQIHYGSTNNDYEIVNNPTSKMLTYTTHPQKIEDLSKATLYHFRMRAVCDKDTSTWTPFLSKKTLISCHTPTNLLASNITTNSFELTWEKATTETQYIIEFYSNKLLSETIQLSTLTHTFEKLSANTDYSVRIRSFCGEADSSAWTPLLNIKTACPLLTEASLPWTTGFEGISKVNQFPDCMGYTEHSSSVYSIPVGTFIEAGNTWFARTGTKGANFSARGGNNAQNDDYLFTPAFELKAGRNYRFSFYYASASMNAANVYELQAKMGTEQTKEGMTIFIGEKLTLNDSTNKDYKQYIADITPEEDGNYFLGIHAITPNENAVGLNIDDIIMERIFDCDYPANVTPESIAATTAKFTWESEATQWEIRHAKMNAEEFIGTVTSLVMPKNTAAEHMLLNLSPETSYGFQIRAICAEEDTSAWTIIEKFTTQAICPKPTQLLISEETTTGFKLTWTPGGTETKWDLSIVEGRVANPVTPYVVSDLANHTFANLSPNRHYTVHLRANCAAADQSYWIMDTATTLCGVEALPYTEGFEKIIKNGELPLCVTTTSSQVVRTIKSLSLDPDPTFNPKTGNAFIYYIASSNDHIYTPAFNLRAGQEYEFSAWWIAADTIDKLSLRYGSGKNTNMKSFAEVVTQVSKTNYKEIKGRFTPTADGTYYLAVYAQSGKSRTLAIDDLSLKEIFPCAAPTILKTSNIGTQSVRFQWTASTDSFALSYRIKDSVNSPYTRINTKDTIYTVSGLRSNTDYTWKVQSICSFENSEEVIGINFRTAEVLCEMPTQTQTSEITSDQAKFAWTSEGNKFEVRFKISTDTAYRTEIVSNAKTLLAISLESNTNYTWSVRNICDEIQKSEWTTPLAFTTLTAPCATPIALNSDNITGTGATLSWASTASNFQVRYKKTSETTYLVQDVKESTLTITNLEPKTDYTWAVRAICAANDTSNWADDKFTTEPLSIEDEQANLLRVYSNRANIYIQNPGQIYFQTIEVVNISGQVIRNHPATNNTSIEITGIKTTGIYILRLLSKNGVQSHKIIIK